MSHLCQKKKVKWLPVVYIYPVEPNLCEGTKVTDSFLGEYMVDEKTSIHVLIGVLRLACSSEGAAKSDSIRGRGSVPLLQSVKSLIE